MKFYSILLLFSICLCTRILAQEKILVSISPMIGTEVDREERDRYNWFSEVPNFISARFYLLVDETYEIQIRFFQNGQINEQNRVITAEAFQDKYQSILEPKKVDEKEERISRRRHRRTESRTRKQIINLRLTDSEVKKVEIANIEDDSIGVIKSTGDKNTNYVSQQKYAIADIENISTVRNTNPALNLGIGITPAVIAALFTYTRFEEHDYNDNDADEKAMNVFYLGEIIGLSVSGTVTAMKSIDYDYVFTGLTQEQKKDKIYQFVNRGLRKKAYARISPWVGIYDFPNYLKDKIIFPGLRFSLCFSPRHRMEFMYGYSKWSLDGDVITTTSYGNVKEFTRFNLIRFGFRTDLTHHQNFNPFIAWGWGFISKQYRERYTYDEYYYPNFSEKERNIDLLLSLDLGLEHHFNRWISAEARMSIVENIDYGLHFMGQFGIHIGAFY